jgi:hypothetical protein
MFLILFGAWVATYYIVRAVLDRPDLSMTARWACVIAPIAGLAGVFTVWMRAMSSADELEKLIHLIGAAIALPLIAVTVLAIGMMQRSGVVKGGAVDLWPWVTFYYLLGYLIARLAYHGDDPTHNEANQP